MDGTPAGAGRHCGGGRSPCAHGVQFCSTVTRVSENTRKEALRRDSHNHELWYLVFLASIFLAPAFDPEAGAGDWIQAGAIAAAAAAIFVLAGCRPPRALPAAAVLVVAAVAGTLLETAAMGALAIYASALSSQVGPRGQIVRRLVASTIIILATIPITPVPMPYVLLMYG